jgi:four helix bundle protein
MSENDRADSGRSGVIRRHTDLDVYKKGFDLAMLIFELSKAFPPEEKYSLTDQVRRSSRSVCANLAEAWRKRRYEAAFVAKLNDSEAEAAETQTWLQFAVKCEYLGRERGRDLFNEYEQVLGMLVRMITNSADWVLKK